MVLVAGATGLVGRELCRRLVNRHEPVRALVRETSDPARVAALQSLGVDIVRGDLRDPASLAAACRGVTAVVTTVSAMPFSYEAGVNDLATTDTAGSLALIEAARKAGVGQFVYTSFSGGIGLDFPLSRAKRAVEDALVEGGLAYTILRPSFFMEVWLSPVAGFDYANAKAVLYGDGGNPISWISTADVAEFAVQSLTLVSALDRRFELGGPEPLAPLQVVAIFEKAGGRPFEVQFVGDDGLRKQQESATDPFQASFAALQRCYARGEAIEMGRSTDTLPVRLTSVARYAETALGREPARAG